MQVPKLMKFDPVNGTPQPYPSEAQQYRDWHGATAWLFNPYSGVQRDARDVGTDVLGKLIFEDVYTPSLAGQSQEHPLISVEEARKLCAGNVEWRWDGGEWAVVNGLFPYFTEAQYRAIKNPEPQQAQYPSPYKKEPVETTCQVLNKDTGELKTMTREAAKLLQVETKDTCDWVAPNGIMPSIFNDFSFETKGIYTYKQKPNLVKLNDKLMSREAAIALWESKKDACDLWMTDINHSWIQLSSTTWCDVSMFAEKIQQAFCKKNGIKHKGDTK